MLHDGDWMPKDAIPVEITGWEETPNTVRIFALSIDGSSCEAVYKGQLDGFEPHPDCWTEEIQIR